MCACRFNDMDILEVGNPPHHCPLARSKRWRGAGDPPCDSTGMNYVEWTTHFSLWVIMKAPVSAVKTMSRPRRRVLPEGICTYATHPHFDVPFQLMIGCDLRQPLCQSALPIFKNTEMLAVSQDDLGVQARRVASEGRLVIGKSGMCRSEELPQNTIIKPCSPSDPLQAWSLHSNGTIHMAATDECLQLDSGQGGCVSTATPLLQKIVTSNSEPQSLSG